MNKSATHRQTYTQNPCKDMSTCHMSLNTYFFCDINDILYRRNTHLLLHPSYILFGVVYPVFYKTDAGPGMPRFVFLGVLNDILETGGGNNMGGTYGGGFKHFTLEKK